MPARARLQPIARFPHSPHTLAKRARTTPGCRCWTRAKRTAVCGARASAYDWESMHPWPSIAVVAHEGGARESRKVTVADEMRRKGREGGERYPRRGGSRSVLAWAPEQAPSHKRRGGKEKRWRATTAESRKKKIATREKAEEDAGPRGGHSRALAGHRRHESFVVTFASRFHGVSPARL